MWPWSQMDSSHGNKSLFQLGNPSYHACLGLQDLYILDLDLGYSLYFFFPTFSFLGNTIPTPLTTMIVTIQIWL
jgi:hypothetical protein